MYGKTGIWTRKTINIVKTSTRFQISFSQGALSASETC